MKEDQSFESYRYKQLVIEYEKSIKRIEGSTKSAAHAIIAHNQAYKKLPLYFRKELNKQRKRKFWSNLKLDIKCYFYKLKL